MNSQGRVFITAPLHVMGETNPQNKITFHTYKRFRTYSEYTINANKKLYCFTAIYNIYDRRTAVTLDEWRPFIPSISVILMS